MPKKTLKNKPPNKKVIVLHPNGSIVDSFQLQDTQPKPKNNSNNITCEVIESSFDEVIQIEKWFKV
jgi:hypothetical protein